jgi:hypothetical protein
VALHPQGGRGAACRRAAGASRWPPGRRGPGRHYRLRPSVLPLRGPRVAADPARPPPRQLRIGRHLGPTAVIHRNASRPCPGSLRPCGVSMGSSASNETATGHRDVPLGADVAPVEFHWGTFISLRTSSESPARDWCSSSKPAFLRRQGRVAHAPGTAMQESACLAVSRGALGGLGGNRPSVARHFGGSSEEAEFQRCRFPGRSGESNLFPPLPGA